MRGGERVRGREAVAVASTTFATDRVMAMRHPGDPMKGIGSSEEPRRKKKGEHQRRGRQHP